MRPLLLLVVACLVLAACSGASAPDATAPEGPVPASMPELEVAAAELPAAVTPEPEPTCTPGEELAMRTDRRAYAAVAKGRTVAFARPGGKRLATFKRLNENRYPTVFGVLTAVQSKDCTPNWYRVQLPMKPNEIEGYVRARDVELVRLHSRIVVDLSKRRLELFKRGRRVLKAAVAIGAPITPTPRGSYYVNQRLTASDPWGPFGPGALGISAFSPVLQEWTQGGPIAIHGTNEPGSIGQAVSHGCIRVRNETLLLLFRMAPAGTPVEVRA
jgi:lipoprotein-anchoring transpeptidase ErfK/SrfK